MKPYTSHHKTAANLAMLCMIMIISVSMYESLYKTPEQRQTEQEQRQRTPGLDKYNPLHYSHIRLLMVFGCWVYVKCNLRHYKKWQEFQKTRE